MQPLPQRFSQVIAGTSSVAATQLSRIETAPVLPTAAQLPPAAPWYDRHCARRQPSPILSKTVSRSPTRLRRGGSPIGPSRLQRPSSLSPRSLNVQLPLRRALSPVGVATSGPITTSSGSIAILSQSTAIEACQACSSTSQLAPPTSAPITLLPSTVVLSARSTGTQPSPRSLSSRSTAITTLAAPVCISTGQELAEQLGQFTASVAALAESIRKSVGGGELDVDGYDDTGNKTTSGGGTGSACGRRADSFGCRGSVVGKIYRVSCSFGAVEDDSSQMSLSQGDLVRIHCRDPSGWTFGRLECPCGSEATKRASSVGKTGWFPEAVLLLDEEEKEDLKGDKLEDAPEEEVPAARISQCSSMSAPETRVPEISDGKATSMEKTLSRIQPSMPDDSDPPVDSDKIWTDVGDTGSTPKRPVAEHVGTEIYTDGDDPWDRCMRLTGIEEEKVRQCERRLAEAARTRRRYLGTCEMAGRGATEAADAVESEKKRLMVLEEQQRKCRVEVSCVASSTSDSMKQSAEAKLRTLEARKENANVNLMVAQERLGQERHTFGVAKERTNAESQVAAVAVEALSRQRTQASTAIRSLVQSTGILQPSNSLEHSKSLGTSSPSCPLLEDSRRSKVAHTGVVKQASPRGTSKDHRGECDDVARSRSQSLQRKAEASRLMKTRTLSANRLAGTTVSRGTSGFPSSGAPPPRSNASVSRASLRYRSQSSSHSPTRKMDDRSQSRHNASREHSRDHLSGTGSSRRQPNASTMPGADNESRAGQQNKSKDSADLRPDSRSRGFEKKATEAELNHMLDVLQTAEALQAKLAAMPEHLRVPLAKHCANLHGIIHTEQDGTAPAVDASTAKAELVAALSAHGGS